MASSTRPTPRHVGSFISSARRGVGSPVDNHRPRRCSVLAAIFILPSLSPALASPWNPGAKIVPDSSKGGDTVGSAVAIRSDGSLAVVGALRADGTVEPRAGAAFVYLRNPQTGAWTESARLGAADGVAFSHFGHAVDVCPIPGSIGGERIVVGAPFGGPEFSNEGVAYIFESDDPQIGMWRQAARLANPSPDQDAWFGWCVAIDGDRAIVGSPQDGDTDYQAGSVTVFLRDAGSGLWRVERELYSSDPGFYELFATSADLAGDIIVAGEPQDSAGGYWAGAAFVFRRDAVRGWEPVQKLGSPNGGRESDLFGETVAVAASGWIAVGAPNDDGRGTNAGGVHLFALDPGSGQFVFRQSIYGSQIEGNDQFSKSLGIDPAGRQVIAGAPWDGTFGTNEGAAYIFKLDLNSSIWSEDAVLRPSDRAVGDWFGFASAIADDGFAIVGVPYDDDRGDGSGSAWIFEDEGAGGGGGGPTIAISGLCPGRMVFDIEGATPNGRVALVAGGKVRSYIVPSGPCAGAQLELAPPFVSGVPFVVRADATGAARLVTDVPADACGVIRVQAVDATTCEVGPLVVVE